MVALTMHHHAMTGMGWFYIRSFVKRVTRVMSEDTFNDQG